MGSLFPLVFLSVETSRGVSLTQINFVSLFKFGFLTWTLLLAIKPPFVNFWSTIEILSSVDLTSGFKWSLFFPFSINSFREDPNLVWNFDRVPLIYMIIILVWHPVKYRVRTSFCYHVNRSLIFFDSRLTLWFILSIKVSSPFFCLGTNWMTVGSEWDTHWFRDGRFFIVIFEV